MSELAEILRNELQDPEYREGYDEGFLDHRIATQIRVLRDQRGLTQTQLGELAGMRQNRISTLEEPEYGAWTVNTLRRLAYALGVRLVVSFEEWSSLLRDVQTSGPEDLKRKPFAEDPAFAATQETVATSEETTSAAVIEFAGKAVVSVSVAASLSTGSESTDRSVAVDSPLPVTETAEAIGRGGRFVPFKPFSRRNVVKYYPPLAESTLLGDVRNV